jgi:hypothetical protein
MTDDTIKRDARLDQVGLVDELYERFRQPLATRIKAQMQVSDRRTGDFFEGLLVGGNKTEVDAEKFFDAFKAGKMTKAQFLSAISVGTKRAKEILGEKDIERISTQSPTSPALRVTRIKGVQIELVTAVKAIAAAIATPEPVAA